MHSIIIEFELGESSQIIYDSLKPELHAAPSERSKVEMTLAGPNLNLFIIAEDIISLRAAINTWLRLVKISEDMLIASKR